MDTKNKIILIVILTFFSLAFVFFYNKEKNIEVHKILKVIEADEYYIDINDNNIIDGNELFKLKDIIALKPIQNAFTKNHSKELGLSLEEYMKTGFLARKFAQDSYLNKDVAFLSEIEKYDENKKYREIQLSLNGVNIAQTLLGNGLAVVKKDSNNIQFLKIQNIKQIKENSKELGKIAFLLLNLKNNIVHNLDCIYAQKIQNGELVLLKNIDKFFPCGFCFKKEEPSNFEINLSTSDIPKNIRKYKSSLYQKFGAVEFFATNPYLYKKPSNSCTTQVCKRLVEEIRSSKKTIDIALYGFGAQSEIFNALVSAKRRGVKIRSVVDYSANMDKIYPNTRNFIKEFDSKTDKPTSLMHNKFFIFDGLKVFTGSYNISEAGSGGYNANSAVLINSSDLAKQYTNEFEQMYEEKFSTSKEKVENSKIIFADFSIQAFFLPKHKGFEEGILPLLKNAKEEIFVSAFYLTDRRMIEELIKAHKRGVKVLVLVDALSASNFKDRIQTLRKENIAVKIENWGAKNHEKTIFIDSKVLVLGSANFSKSAFYKNDENFLIITNEKLAKAYRDFYLYLFNSIDDKFLKLYPRAESVESFNSCHDGIDNDYDGKIDSDDEGCK